MPVELLLLALSPVFFTFILYEFLKYKQYYELKDSFANMVLALMHQFADALALVVLMPFFYWLHQFAFFEIELDVATVLIAFILQDFLYYWFHRASHHIHWFWAAHVVHHSSNKMNFTTAFRQSFFYPLVGMWLFWLPMIVLGFDPKFVFAVVAINLGFQFFVHTQIVDKLGAVEYLFNTPSHHRVHHSINKGYIDKNFAGVLIIWDKLFGTFAQEQDKSHNRYGIIGACDSTHPWTISVMQWRLMKEQLRTAPNLQSKLSVLFGYPSHQLPQSSIKHDNKHSTSDNTNATEDLS